MGRVRPSVIDWLNALAEKLDRRIMVRLVKGAYWDTEIKRAQVMGLAGYPVFTRKANTDVSYIACAKKLLGMTDRLYPQFATHNAHTVANHPRDGRGPRPFSSSSACTAWARHCTRVVRKAEGTRCRIYAPVGAHEDLLAYLVRRLLENGANSSFVHQIIDEDVPAEEIARDPFDVVARQGPAHNWAIPFPTRDLRGRSPQCQGLGPDGPGRARRRSRRPRAPFAAPHRWQAGGKAPRPGPGARWPIRPFRKKSSARWWRRMQMRSRRLSARRVKAQAAWAARPVAERGDILRRIAGLYEENAIEFFTLATREAGQDAVRRHCRGPRGGRLPALLCQRGCTRGEHRCGARRHRLHLALEFSAGDLHRAGGGSTCSPAMRWWPSRRNRHR